MNALPELIEQPLSPTDLAARYRAMCKDPLLSKVPGKLELDIWGRILMTPPNNRHGIVQFRVGQCLASLGGTVLIESSVVTSFGIFVADVAWASPQFMASHSNESPYNAAPEICVEVVSPSNSKRELREKMTAYLEAGAKEAWIVYPTSKRIEYFTADGQMSRSGFEVDISGIFVS